MYLRNEAPGTLHYRGSVLEKLSIRNALNSAELI